MAERGSKMLKSVIHLITKMSVDRSDDEIEAFIPWLCKISALFAFLKKEVLTKLLKNCKYLKVFRDHVIIRQGDTGNCFYIMLTGRASLFIDIPKLDESMAKKFDNESETETGTGTENKTETETESETETRNGKIDHNTPEDQQTPKDDWLEEFDSKGGKIRKLDRSKFGNFINNFEAGMSFGEMALMTANAVRKGTIIADDEIDLLVIDKTLFDETLKDKQEEEYKERKNFVDNSPLFSNWMPKMKRLIEMSLKKIVLSYDSHIVRQGDPVTGIHFIISGQAKVTIEPTMHRAQYPKVLDRQSKIYKEINANLNKKDVRGVSTRETPLLSEMVRIRRHEGYTAAEKRLSDKQLTLCVVDNSEIVGALELISGLDTYAQSVITTCKTQLFVLDNRNIDRLIFKQKHTTTIDVLTDQVYVRLRARLASQIGSQIELYHRLFATVTEIKTKKSNQEKFVLMSAEFSSKNDDEARLESTDQPTIGKRSVVSPDPQHKISVSRHKHKQHPKSAYYQSKLTNRSERFASSYLQMRANQYGRHTTLSGEGQMLMAKRAVRLLPRSRRELEKMVLGDNKTKSLLENQNHVIYRYFSPIRGGSVEDKISRSPTSASPTVYQSSNMREDFESRFGEYPDSYFDQTDSPLPYLDDFDSYEDMEDPDDAITLSLEDSLYDERLREIVLKIGNYHQKVTEARKENICSISNQRKLLEKLSRQMVKRSSVAGSNGPRYIRRQTKHTELIPFDWETSEVALNRLEDRIKQFYVKNNIELDRQGAPFVRSLKPFSIKTSDDAPIPAGTVYVCSRPQTAKSVTSSSSVAPKKQIRRFIVPKDAYPILSLSRPTTAPATFQVSQ